MVAGDDNGLCGLFATINAVRWLWPELRHKDDDGEERVAALALHLVRDRLNAAQFKALYLDGDELLCCPNSWIGRTSGFGRTGRSLR